MVRQPSRAARWAAAAQRAAEALEELQDLQSGYEGWRDGMPENLQGSMTYEKLDAVCNIDLSSAIEVASEAMEADLPRGFGRD